MWLGDQERDLHAGGLVFIPANTWRSGKNIGATPIGLTFVFSASGFEETMTMYSVRGLGVACWMWLGVRDDFRNWLLRAA